MNAASPLSLRPGSKTRAGEKVESAILVESLWGNSSKIRIPEPTNSEQQQGYLADSFVDNPERGRKRLESSLTGKAMDGLLEPDSLSGMFYPGFRGDPNIGQSFDAKTRANPWDFILLMEGLLFFRSAVTR